MRELRGHMDVTPRGGGAPQKLEYLWLGPAPHEAPTLVLLHEGLGSVTTWRDFPAELAQKTGCGVLVYSRKGYGTSDPCELPRPTSYMHEEAREILGSVLDQWKIESCILVGHSDGASISTIYAGEFDDNRVRGLVLMAPHFFVEALGVAAIEESTNIWETTDFRERLARHHGSNVECAFWGWNRVWLENDFRKWNIEEYLPKIKVPVLIIQGVDDPYGTERQWLAAEAKCTVPVTVAALPDCQHAPFRESPVKTMTACRNFVGEIFPVNKTGASAGPV